MGGGPVASMSSSCEICKAPYALFPVPRRPLPGGWKGMARVAGQLNVRFLAILHCPSWGIVLFRAWHAWAFAMGIRDAAYMGIYGIAAGTRLAKLLIDEQFKTAACIVKALSSYARRAQATSSTSLPSAPSRQPPEMGGGGGGPSAIPSSTSPSGPGTVFAEVLVALVLGRTWVGELLHLAVAGACVGALCGFVKGVGGAAVSTAMLLTRGGKGLAGLVVKVARRGFRRPPTSSGAAAIIWAALLAAGGAIFLSL